MLDIGYFVTHWQEGRTFVPPTPRAQYTLAIMELSVSGELFYVRRRAEESRKRWLDAYRSGDTYKGEEELTTALRAAVRDEVVSKAREDAKRDRYVPRSADAISPQPALNHRSAYASPAARRHAQIDGQIAEKRRKEKEACFTTTPQAAMNTVA